jgi:hypothetical protein
MANRPTQAGHRVRPNWQPVVAIVVVAIVACIAGIGNELAQDDIYLVRDNAMVHSVANVGAMFASPFWPPPFSPDLYRPLTSLLLALEFQLGFGDPAVFRIVSYALYAAVAVNVYLFARDLLPRGFALAAALLFAAHPVHVEATALAVGQSELMVALIAVVMVRRYCARRATGALTTPDWAIIAALYLTAALFKEQGLVLPLLLVAAEALLVNDERPARWRELSKGMLALAAIGVALLLVRRAVVGELAGSFVAEALVGVSFTGRLLTMCRVAVAWLRLLIWPAHLQLDYSPQEIVASTALGPTELLGAVALVGLIAGAWLLRRKSPAFAFAVAWCAVALFPVSNVIVPTGIVLAERTLFLPSVGFVIGLAALSLLIVERLAAPTVTRGLQTTCALLMSLGLGRSIERQRVWRDDAFLAVRTVQDAPRSFRAQRIFGDVAFDLRQPRLGLAAFTRALDLAPPAQRWRVHNDIARTFRRMGDVAAEADHLRSSLAQRADQEDTRGYLIAADLALGAYAEARRLADSAVARGDARTVFDGLRRLADSAEKAGAPPGSIRVGINTGDVRRGP